MHNLRLCISELIRMEKFTHFPYHGNVYPVRFGFLPFLAFPSYFSTFITLFSLPLLLVVHRIRCHVSCPDDKKKRVEDIFDIAYFSRSPRVFLSRGGEERSHNVPVTIMIHSVSLCSRRYTGNVLRFESFDQD